MDILKINDLRTYFYVPDGIIKAVDGISFNLKDGETLGIVGESGSGKSITALSILRLISYPGKIVTGEIIFNGIDLLKLSNEEIRNIRGKDISIVFQDPMTSLNPVLTVGKQIIEVIKLHQGFNKKEAKEKAIELLNKVGIPNAIKRINQYPHEFSGGMRQRAMIAMALACKPKIFIADEPTTALDVTTQAQIINLINEQKEELKSSVIIITHDLGVIAEMADNVLIMYAGKVMEYGDVNTIFTNPLHPYTIGLLESIPIIGKRKNKLIPISGNPPSMLNLPKGCRFSTRCRYVNNICIEKEPELKTVNFIHKYACHFDNIKGGS